MRFGKWIRVQRIYFRTISEYLIPELHYFRCASFSNWTFRHKSMDHTFKLIKYLTDIFIHSLSSLVSMDPESIVQLFWTLVLAQLFMCFLNSKSRVIDFVCNGDSHIGHLSVSTLLLGLLRQCCSCVLTR